MYRTDNSVQYSQDQFSGNFIPIFYNSNPFTDFVLFYTNVLRGTEKAYIIGTQISSNGFGKFVLLRYDFMGRRVALTLVELLVVIAIVGTLLAIILPAMQTARESSRRSHCTNNMRQLGLAALNYEASHNRLPPAYTNGTGENGLNKSKHSFFAFILPYIECSSISERYFLRYDWNEAKLPSLQSCNRNLTYNENIEIYHCPSVPIHELAATSDYAIATRFATGSDSAIESLVQQGLVNQRQEEEWSGMLDNFGSTSGDKRFKFITSEDIGDGASNTIMISECGGRPNTFFRGTLLDEYSAEGARWADNENAFWIHNYCNEVQLMNCNNRDEIYSFHFGGGNFTFGDGSVQFLSESISPEVFVSVFTRSGGEVVSASKQ